MKRFLKALLILSLVVEFWLAASVVGAIIPGRHRAIGGEPTVRIGLIAGLIHYDFLLPLRPDVQAEFAFAEPARVPISDPGAEWLVVGWGAREFYTTTGSYSNLSAYAVWTALTGDTSVMRIDVAGPVPDEIPVAWLDISEAQFTALRAAILDSFDPLPPVPVEGAGFTDTDRFFDGKGGFHAIRTCNVWVGEMLRASGIRFGVWTPAPWSVRLSLWWFSNG